MTTGITDRSLAHSPLIIELRSNETADRAGNRAIPYGPDEIISDALSAVEAGASMIHWHATDDEGVEHPGVTELYRKVISGIRAQSDVLLHPTLGFMGTQNNAQARVQHILELNADPGTKVDIVPVDFGSFGADVWNREDMRFLTDDNFVLNRVGYLKELLAVLKQNHVRVMSVVWSPGAVRTARVMQELELLPQPAYWQLGFTGDAVPGGPPPTLANLNAFLEVLPQGDPWTIHVRDGDGMAMAAWAITLGGHVSIGLGDDPYQRLGRPSNADLVRRMVQIAETVGRPVATTAQAREIIGV
jgi:uncharacterized protein (DUF849 family)